MSDHASLSLEATKETAKAVQELAKLGSKLTDATMAGGRWIDDVGGGPLQDTIGLIWGDRVRTARVVAAIADYEKLMTLLVGAKRRLDEIGAIERRDLPPKIGLALLEAATVEEDEGLQSLWANLLASAVNGSSDPVERSYVSILADLAPADAIALRDYYSRWPVSADQKPFRGDGIIYSPALTAEDHGFIVAQNLRRLGLIEPVTNRFWNFQPHPSYDRTEDDIGTVTSVSIAGDLYGFTFTDLGVAFCGAVGLNSNRPDQKIP